MGLHGFVILTIRTMETKTKTSFRYFRKFPAVSGASWFSDFEYKNNGQNKKQLVAGISPSFLQFPGLGGFMILTLQTKE